MRKAKAQKAVDTPLSRRTIAEAALAIIRKDGAEALSARRLAAGVGCEAMSLYHHFDGMEDILDDVVDLILEEIAPARSASRGQRAIEARAGRYLALSDDAPACFRLIATRRWKGPAGAARAREMAALFVAAGATERQAMAATRALGAYLNGAGLALSAWKARGEDARAVKADLDAGLRKLVCALLPAD